MHNKNPEERTEYPLKYADARVKAENKEFWVICAGIGGNKGNAS